MKPAKEFEWLLKLRDCKFKRGLIKTIGGCKSEFERCLGISENDKEFRKWFDILVSLGVIEVFERKNMGGIKEVDSFVFNQKEVDKLIEKNNIHPFAKKFYDRDRIF